MILKSEHKLRRKYSKKLLYTLITILGAIALIVYFLPRSSEFNYQFEINKPWRYGQLIANFNFPIYKNEKVVKKEYDSLQMHFQPYYTLKKNTAEKQITQLSKAMRQKHIPSQYQYYIIHKLRKVYAAGIISTEEMNKLKKNRTNSVLITDNKIANEQVIDKIFTTISGYQFLLQDSLGFNTNIIKSCDLNDFIIPNITFNETRTNLARKDMMNNYSWATGYVQSGQKIVDRGEIINQETYNILQSLRKESAKQNQSISQKRLIICGQILFVSILFSCFITYLLLFRKYMFNKKNNLLLLLSSIIFYCLLTSFIVKNNLINVYTIPFAMIPIILRVFLDSRTAFITLLVTIFICSITLHYPYEFVIVQLTAGLVSVYSLSELTKRSQLLRTAFFVTLTYIIVYFSIELIIENDFSMFNLNLYKYFIINGIFLLFAYPILFMLEKVFGFTSNVTLVELSNTNNPLLHKMSEFAPGTFQHSIQVANLASEAANEIGANSELIRTGALYHDIGKLENPDFFTENQTNNINPHKDLSYEQSAQIVISHVRYGLKLADKYHLPTVIKEFICTHHGCGKTKFFYISWKNEHQGEEPDEKLFTYPGPNPFTKETAILMMTDSIEAASRSMTEHTENSINNLVDHIIDQQIADHAFENCPITFRDITRLKALFKEKLQTIYHVRIHYPELKA